MVFEGRFWKEGKFWLIEVPALNLVTQGKSKSNALYMIADAVECLVEKEGFKAKAVQTGPDRFLLSSSDLQSFIALFLQQQRGMAGLTIREVCDRLGSTSLNAYARYEQGKAMPTLGKLQELFQALRPHARLRIDVTSE